MRSRKTEIYGGLRGCIQKVIHFMHKVIPRYPVESPVDKVDSQFLRQVFTAVSCGAGMAAKTWLGELRRLCRGNCADAARAHKRVDTCGFHPLVNPPFPLESLAQTRDRRPLRNRRTAEDFFFRMDALCAPCIHIFAGSDTFLLHRRVTLSRVRHNSAARFVSEL